MPVLKASDTALPASRAGIDIFALFLVPPVLVDARAEEHFFVEFE
jgi:hypothetical protein